MGCEVADISSATSLAKIAEKVDCTTDKVPSISDYFGTDERMIGRFSIRQIESGRENRIDSIDGFFSIVELNGLTSNSDNQFQLSSISFGLSRTYKLLSVWIHSTGNLGEPIITRLRTVKEDIEGKEHEVLMRVKEFMLEKESGSMTDSDKRRLGRVNTLNNLMDFIYSIKVHEIPEVIASLGLKKRNLIALSIQYTSKLDRGNNINFSEFKSFSSDFIDVELETLYAIQRIIDIKSLFTGEEKKKLEGYIQNLTNMYISLSVQKGTLLKNLEKNGETEMAEEIGHTIINEGGTTIYPYGYDFDSK